MRVDLIFITLCLVLFIMFLSLIMLNSSNISTCSYCNEQSYPRSLVQYAYAPPPGNYTSDGGTSGESGGGGGTSGESGGGGGTSGESGGGGGTKTTSSRCLIATAAFGSDLSPQVQFLRNFRDNRILSTASGSSFMNVFNTWYYSFSPSVADYERGQPWLQGIVRLGIYPLLGILQVSEKSYSIIPGEYGAVVAGLTASSLIGLVYFTPVALCIKTVRTNRNFNFKVYAVIAAIVTISLLIALLINNRFSLMITTPLFVVTVCAITSTLGARMTAVMSRSLISGLKKRNWPTSLRG